METPNHKERTNPMQNTKRKPTAAKQEDSEELDLVITSGASKAFSITADGIIIRKDLSVLEWRNGLRAFRWAQLNLKVGLADYIKFGELNFGSDKTAEALHQLEFPMSEITRAVEINSIPENIRLKGLSAEHLVVLARANVPQKTQTMWARVAVEQHLTPGQLKESIRQNEVVSTQMANKNNHGVITIHGIRQETEIWLRRMGGLNELKKLSKEQKEEIAGEVALFVEIYEAVKV